MMATINKLEMQNEEVKEKVSQSEASLDENDLDEDHEAEYVHLMSHLSQERKGEVKHTEWTRVFSRDSDSGKRVAIFAFGQDSNYDRSVRDLLLQTESFDGEILFSPQNFNAKDLPKNLSQCELDYGTLLHFAKLATKVKERFSKAEKALREADQSRFSFDESIHQHEIVEMKRGYELKKSSLPIDKMLLHNDNCENKIRRTFIKRH